MSVGKYSTPVNAGTESLLRLHETQPIMKHIKNTF
jgi:hypothetical protein